MRGEAEDEEAPADDDEEKAEEKKEGEPSATDTSIITIDTSKQELEAS